MGIAPDTYTGAVDSTRERDTDLFDRDRSDAAVAVAGIGGSGGSGDDWDLSLIHI